MEEDLQPSLETALEASLELNRNRNMIFELSQPACFLLFNLIKEQVFQLPPPL